MSTLEDNLIATYMRFNKKTDTLTGQEYYEKETDGQRQIRKASEAVTGAGAIITLFLLAFKWVFSQTNKTPSKVDMVVLVPLLIGSVLLVLMVLWASLSVLIDTWTKGEEMGVIQWIMLFILPCSALPSIWLYRTMTNRK